MKPRLRGVLHQVVFFVAVPAGVALVLVAPTEIAKVAVGIYALSLCALLAASSAYHRGVWSSVARSRMRRLDHCMIFVLIAGTYTPFALLVLHGAPSIVLLAAVWAGALAGIVMKVFDLRGSGVVCATLYIVLGWLVILDLPALVRGLTSVELGLVVAGGLLYTVGSIVLLTNRPDPDPKVFGYHEVWHAMMVTAATCHYVAILLVLLAL